MNLVFAVGRCVSVTGCLGRGRGTDKRTPSFSLSCTIDPRYTFDLPCPSEQEPAQAGVFLQHGENGGGKKQEKKKNDTKQDVFVCEVRVS